MALAGLAATSALVIYAVTVLLSRFGGARTLASVSAFDFIANVAVGAMVGSVIVSPNVGLVSGVVGVGSVFAMQLMVGVLRRRRALQAVIDTKPMLLMRRGRVLENSLSATRLTENDLHSAMRAANVHRYDDVDAIVLEKTGSMSVLHHAAPTAELDPRLLSGVQGAETA